MKHGYAFQAPNPVLWYGFAWDWYLKRIWIGGYGDLNWYVGDEHGYGLGMSLKREKHTHDFK